jgi:hypothetical protein
MTHRRKARATESADPERSYNTGDDTGIGPERGPATRTPRWVSVLGIVVAIVLVVVLVVLHLTGVLGRGAH